MKIKETNFFKKNLFESKNKSNLYFTRVKKTDNQIRIETVAISNLTKSQKIYMRFSDCFGIELRKISKVCNSKEAKQLIGEKSYTEQVSIRHNIQHINQRIAQINKKYCCLPKIQLIDDFKLKEPSQKPIKKAISLPSSPPKPLIQKKSEKMKSQTAVRQKIRREKEIEKLKKSDGAPSRQKRHSIDLTPQTQTPKTSIHNIARRHSAGSQGHIPDFIPSKDQKPKAVPKKSVSIKEKKVLVKKKQKAKKVKAPRGLYPIETLQAFYRNEGKDDKGRTIADMWNYSNDEKESYHNYIQWLFPLKDPTGNNPTAPILTQEQIEVLKKDPTVIANMRTSFQKMLKFYGMKLNDDGTISGLRLVGKNQFKITKAFQNRSPNWFTHKHNHLRITRIIKSLRLFGLEAEAQAFYKILSDIKTAYPKKISDETMNNFWKPAAA